MGKHVHDHGAHDDVHHGRDEWARQHHEVGDLREPELSKATQRLLEAARVGPGSRVLDVACGAGYTAAAATAAGADAMGLDSSPQMIRIANERFPRTHFVVGDMRAPPIGPWDAVVCRLGAHHADPSWLAAVWGALKPGGRLAIAERDAVNEGDRENGMKSLAEWRLLFERAGFENVEIARSDANLNGPIYVVSGRKGRHGEG